MNNCESEYEELVHDLKDKVLDNKNGDEQLVNCMAKNMTTVLSRKKRAAVLICIFTGTTDGELRVILTRRSMNLSSHPGDVALPGGKMDEGDVDDSATALREATEEIGLDPGLVRVVANLDPFISSNLLRVVPVVGLLSRIQDFKPVLNPDEVDAIFDAPLEMFLQVS
ncbi:PREDICTED: nudix hydrolase 15, mitochondrial-like, partial [Erythranthe guttata]|uniref:nudix hydrolase 15, mitochondrial-like n=1 Tax=Erythranthe guttata TaxID=4155 RepID=UPI00064D93E8